MSESHIEKARLDADIRAVRSFNRFYTARLGLLKARHLDGEFSLTEARLLYEIGLKPGVTASCLRDVLELDEGYISRSVAKLSRKKLVRQKPSETDGREKLLSLTASGEKAAAKLDEQSSRQMAAVLSELTAESRKAVVWALSEVHTRLRENTAGDVRINRVLEVSSSTRSILDEFYQALQVMQRDSPAAIQKIVEDATSGVWLASCAGEVVGCVLLRRLTSIPDAGECKRLYVKPAFRGRRIAEQLLDTMEKHAREKKFIWVYLDTHEGLKAAIALYRKRGYVECDRYNDNPQASLFMRKEL